MIQGVGSGASLAQSAIEAALKAHENATRRIEAELDPSRSVGDAHGTNFSKLVSDGMREADARVAEIESLPGEIVTGRVSDFHEIAAQIKQSELTFKFALEVRNKLIDAYRETMRMSV